MYILYDGVNIFGCAENNCMIGLFFSQQTSSNISDVSSQVGDVQPGAAPSRSPLHRVIFYY